MIQDSFKIFPATVAQGEFIKSLKRPKFNNQPEKL